MEEVKTNPNGGGFNYMGTGQSWIPVAGFAYTWSESALF